MRRRSAVTGLIVDSSLVLQELVIVLSDPERGSAINFFVTAARSVDSCRTIVANSRTELVIVPSIIVEEKRLSMTSSGQVWSHTK